MKYATAAAAVLPLAWAANIDARGDTKYNISKLEASCDSDDKCSYNMQIATGDDSDSTSCSLKSIMKLGAAPESKCGPYTVSAVKPHDGGINFLVNQGDKGLKGVFTVYPKDMKKTESDDGEVMSYKGGDAFDVAAKASGAPAKTDGDKSSDDDGDKTEADAPKVSTIMSHAAMEPPSGTTKLSSIASVGAPIDELPTAAPTGTLKVAPSAAPTAGSGGSTLATATATATGSSSSATSSSAASDDDDKSSSSSSSSGSSGSSSSGTETSSSDSSASSDESSGASHQSAFAAVMAAVGLLAFAL
ncbi:uncharacterized protein PG986_012651 [Apiospora aurea]|uniref:Uncharacterized protein n=1 Tax=Apiospora aurea TaxID=335848 RepID=A0ABR1Q0M1_9PEZI